MQVALLTLKSGKNYDAWRHSDERIKQHFLHQTSQRRTVSRRTVHAKGWERT